MTPERHRQIEEIRQLALECDPASRAEFLAKVCASDERLRREVESLLAYEHAEERSLTRSALDTHPQSIPESAESLIGRQVGPYEVLSSLGSGGMAEVYRGRDTRLYRQVAIKRLPSVLTSDSERRARFAREARLLASLNHPNIAAIYDIVEFSGSPALVLELVEGETLWQRLERGRSSATPAFTPAEALSVAEQIAAAMDAAHSQGVIHCDLKPANIVVTPEGIAKVLDFGIGMLAAGRGSAVGSRPGHEIGGCAEGGFVFGTPAYMSPEQIRGTADERADVWALGCIVYEMVSGRQAFCGGPSAADALARVLNDEPDWHPLGGDLPPTLRTLVQTCLRKDTRQRLRNMRAVLIHIDRARDEISGVQAGSDAWHRIEAVRAIAVSAFDFHRTEGDMAYLAEGIAGRLMEGLSHVPGLTVLAAATARHHCAEWNRDPASAARLGVRAVLTGSIRHVDSMLTVTVTLVDTLDRRQLWSRQYVRRSGDVGGIQETIASDVVTALHLRLSHDEWHQLSKRQTASSGAYELYLKGRYALNKRTASGFTQALTYFRAATRLDSGYAQAFAGIADCYTLLPFYDRGLPRPSYELAKTAATKALELDDRLPEAYTALGHLLLYYDWDWTAADGALRRAIELAPGSSSAHGTYGNYLAAVGRLDAAIAECRQALSLDPVSLPLNVDLAIVLYFARRYEEAVQQLEAAVELDDSYAPAHAILGWVHAQSGRFAKSRAAGEKALSLDDSPWVLASMAYTHALAGDPEAAQGIARTLMQGRGGDVSSYDLAALNALLGERKEAVAYLRVAYAERSGLLVWGLLNDPKLDSIRGESAFVQIGRDMHLPVES